MGHCMRTYRVKCMVMCTTNSLNLNPQYQISPKFCSCSLRSTLYKSFSIYGILIYKLYAVFFKKYLHVGCSIADAMQTVLLREHKALLSMIFLSFYTQNILLFLVREGQFGLPRRYLDLRCKWRAGEYPSINVWFRFMYSQKWNCTAFFISKTEL